MTRRYRLPLLTLFAVCLGLLTCVALPFLFVAWLSGWLVDTWAGIVGAPLPLRCDGDQSASDARLAAWVDEIERMYTR